MAAAQDVQAAITAAGRQLPQTLSTPPTYRKVNPADSPILVLAARSDSLPITQVDDITDNVLAQQISQITGVAQVIIGGEQKPAIRVQVDPAKLQTRGLTLEDVRGVPDDRDDERREGHDQHRAAELHDPGQRSGDQGRAIRRRHHRLPQRRAGSRARRRPRGAGSAGRQHRGREGRERRRAQLRAAAGVQAAGRERDPDRERR